MRPTTCSRRRQAPHSAWPGAHRTGPPQCDSTGGGQGGHEWREACSVNSGLLAKTAEVGNSLTSHQDLNDSHVKCTSLQFVVNTNHMKVTSDLTNLGSFYKQMAKIDTVGMCTIAIHTHMYMYANTHMYTALHTHVQYPPQTCELTRSTPHKAELTLSGKSTY